MTFIRNNPITQQRRAADYFESDVISTEQQENKTLQKIIHGHVRTRSDANPMTTELINPAARWLGEAELKGQVLPFVNHQDTATTWGAGEDEIASIRASSAAGSKREILFLEDIQSSSNSYPDMSGAEVPEELAKLEQRAKVDPLSMIPDPETLKKYSLEASVNADENPWKKKYSREFINKVTYRGDARLPDELFYSGFIRRPIPIQMVEIAGGDGIIGAVSTTTDEKIALKYAKNQAQGGYVYAVRLKEGGVAINSMSLRGEPLSEIAVLNVPPEDIILALGPFDTRRTVVQQQELNSIELRLNPYSAATYEQAKEAFDALKGKLPSALIDDEKIAFSDRWDARKDLLFYEKDYDIYMEEKLEALKS